MKITLTQEKRGEIERIQREFRQYLSPNEILRGTSQAINGVMSRSIPKINKAIKADYNITQKYLSRMAVVSPKASMNALYAGIKINEQRLPMIAFRPKQKGSDISVAFHRGKNEVFRNSFIAMMNSGHTGVFSRGKYIKGRGFVPGREKTATGKTRITQLMGTSVFNMGISNKVAQEVQQYMSNEAAARVHGILTNRVNKLTANK